VSFSCLIATAALGGKATYARTPAGTQAAATSSQPRRTTTPPMDPNKIDTVPFQAVHGNNEPDKLSRPRLLAPAIVDQFGYTPHKVADVGAFQGEFIEAFLARFPKAEGLWTDPVDVTQAVAKKRLARFGDRVTYKLTCLDRDISDGCIPKDTDVILSSWVSMHQPIQGMAKFDSEAYAQLPSGGWLILLDHIGIDADNPFAGPLKAAMKEFHAAQEGPAARFKTEPSIEEQVYALKDAGFENVQVVWQDLTDALFMARKN
jgi:hypothetical protein